MFEHILGNDHIKQYLTRMVAKKAVGNSLLFAGPDGIGKSLFARELAKMILCSDDHEGKHLRKLEAGNHPDLRIYRPEGKIGMHSINSMRQFSEDVYLAPFEAKWKVFIIQDADRMLTYSANALLKTFEEPAQDSIIILISSAPSSLLPTVLSRCRTIRFNPLSEDEVANYLQMIIKKSTEEAKSFAALSGGSIGNAINLIEQGGNAIRQKILMTLSRGNVSTYQELSKLASEIADQIDESKKQEEELVRSELLKGTFADLTASQQQNLEKEIEGAVAMRQAIHAQALFENILSWYRDMNLLHANGNRAYLINRDFEEEIEQALQQGGLLSIEEAQKAASDATLSLERSTPLNIVLERLFLQLNLL